MFEDLSLALPFVSSAAESEIDLAALVEAYSTLLFRIANSVVRNATESEDIVQDVFVRLVQHKGTLPEVRDLRVWLVRIAWNLAVDRRRRIRPEQFGDTFIASLTSSDAPAEKLFIESQRLRVVIEAMERLPKAEHQALSLSAMDELTVSEIAGIMGKSESAVRALIFRARTHLRERLNKQGVR